MVTSPKPQTVATAKYQAKVIRQVMVKLHRVSDEDILSWLEGQDSKQGSIKQAIRAWMEKEKQKEN